VGAQACTMNRVSREGFHTWTLAEIEQVVARYRPGSKAHLALQVLLRTGARRSDAHRLGRPHLRDGMIRWTVFKGRRRHPRTIEIDFPQPLAEALARGLLGEVTWLVTEDGQTFTHAGFGNWFKDRCRGAGLGHCSAHARARPARPARPTMAPAHTC
jgi:integrase